MPRNILARFNNAMGEVVSYAQAGMRRQMIEALTLACNFYGQLKTSSQQQILLKLSPSFEEASAALAENIYYSERGKRDDAYAIIYREFEEEARSRGALALLNGDLEVLNLGINEEGIYRGKARREEERCERKRELRVIKEAQQKA